MYGLINCRGLANSILKESQNKIQKLQKPPCVVILSVGKPEKHLSYPHKHAAQVAKKLGIEWRERQLGEDAGMNEVVAAISACNSDPTVNGIVLHRPFPEPLSMRILHQTVQVNKDVEGMHPSTLGKLVFMGSAGTKKSSGPRYSPCTARAAFETFKLALQQDTRSRKMEGLEVLVVGNSNILAKPVCSYLQAAGTTVTVCSETIPNLAAHTRAADVIITAVNRGPNLITGEMIKPGAVIIDLGINRLNKETSNSWNVCGDVQLATVNSIAKVATLSNGVGILRTAILMSNIANSMS